MRLYELLHVLPWDLPVTLCDLSAAREDRENRENREDRENRENREDREDRDDRNDRPVRTTAQDLIINPEAYTLVTYYFMDSKDNTLCKLWSPCMFYDVSHIEVSMGRVTSEFPLEPVAKIYIRKHGPRDSISEIHRIQDEIRQELSEKIGD